jgi:tetratricopeptide (TPR) repeat protein
MGVLSVAQGRNDLAERYFRRCVELMPEWQSSLSTLGMFYFETGQIAKARETLNRSMELNPHAGLDFKQVQEALAAASATERPSSRPQELSLEARAQFLQTALALIDQNP